MAKSKKKPSAAQLRARANFSRIMKAGGFKKKSKSSKVKSKRRVIKRKSPVKRRSTKSKSKRSSGGTISGKISDAKKMRIINTVMRMKLPMKKKLSILKTLDKVI